MSWSPKGEQVLRDIFAIGSDRALGLSKRLRFPTPGSNELFEFCELLASTPKEEALQTYLERNPGYLTGLLGGPDNADLAILFKPFVGTRFRADFCVLQSHQGGSVVNIIEIESSHDSLFTRAGRPSSRLSSALTQLEDWKIAIERDRRYHASELVRMAVSCPMLGEQVEDSRGIRLAEGERIRSIWDAFGGSDDPFFTYTVIQGRWSGLSPEEKARVIGRNRTGYPKIHTFEQLARNANFRLERDDWHNDLDRWEVEDFKAEDRT